MTEPDKTVSLQVYRFDPDSKSEPHFEEFSVPADEGTTVLDGLCYIRDTHDPSLAFRHSCRQGVCGSDALYINGTQRLGCKTKLGELTKPVRIEPLPTRPVARDLVVDMEDFYDHIESVEPYSKRTGTPGDLDEERQSPTNREAIKPATRCIWCGACSSACSIPDEKYIGPAAINQAYRFIADEREPEEAADSRLDVVADTHGIWRCQTQFTCTDVCPKDIPLTEHIQTLKRKAATRSLLFGALR